MYETAFSFLIESLNKHRKIDQTYTQTHTDVRYTFIKSWLSMTCLSNKNIKEARFGRFHKRKMNKQIENEGVMGESDKNDSHLWYASLYAWLWR